MKLERKGVKGPTIWGCRAVVKLTETKMKNLGEKESKDAIFDEERFTSIPRPKGMIKPSSSKIVEDEVEEGTRDKTLSQRKYCFIIEEDPRTLSETMASKDVAFWKEAIQSEIDSIMHNDTWELTDLPPRCKALGSLAAILDLDIHQMDVKNAFLNGDLDKKIYMKQPEGFVMPGLESKCVHRKFDASGKGVIICLYVDDMLIFGTVQDQVNKTKEFLSSKFDMKDLGEAEVILGIRIKRGNNGKLSMYTSNPSALHWQALGRVFQYLKGTMDYGLTYSGYPSVIEGYFDSSWFNNMEDHSSTSGWVFLLGEGRFNLGRTSLTGFPAQSIRSSNAIALDSPYLLVLNTGASQSRQHESRKPPTAELFDVDSGRIFIHHCEY
nr:hypothetical protein [Tanacetum cinerariifolium]